MIDNISMLALGIAIGKTNGTIAEIYDFLQALTGKYEIDFEAVRTMLCVHVSNNIITLSTEGVYSIQRVRPSL